MYTRCVVYIILSLLQEIYLRKGSFLSSTYVLYHSDKDGQGSAYAAWRKLGDNANYIAVDYKQPVPEMEDGSIVYIVDFSYNKDTIKIMSERMEKVVVIDHHKSAIDDLKDLMLDSVPNLELVFDITKAGCILTHEYFFPNQPIPTLLLHIADRDLWKFELAGTKEIHEMLCSHSFNFELWSQFVSTLPALLMREGEAILRAANRSIKNICRNAVTMMIGEDKVLAVNTSYKSSEVCHYLLDMIENDSEYKDCKFAVVYRDERINAFGPDSVDDQVSRRYDLRSRGDFDVSEIAKKFGGGGHKNAAGFHVRVHKASLG